jgi:hypothetical protein
VSGYATTARIRGATPRFVEADRDPWAVARALPRPVVDDLPDLIAGAGDHLETPPPTVTERWAAARERWSQLTFYLFDPESWR